MQNLPKLYDYETLPYANNKITFTNVFNAFMFYLSVSMVERTKRNSNEVPLWHKYSLSFSEAATYFGIGEKRLRQLVSEHPNSDFILEIGTHVRFKRVMFEDYLNTVGCV